MKVNLSKNKTKIPNYWGIASFFVKKTHQPSWEEGKVQKRNSEIDHLGEEQIVQLIAIAHL